MVTVGMDANHSDRLAIEWEASPVSMPVCCPLPQRYRAL